MNSSQVTLRPVQDDDDPFLLSVYGSTREQKLAQVPWTPEQKQVLKVSPVLRLFQRLGFTTTGEDQIYMQMELRPSSHSQNRSGVPK